MEKTKDISMVEIAEKFKVFEDDSQYNVIFLNDPDTWFEFVKLILVEVFDYDNADAHRKTKDIEKNGQAIVATLPMETAYEKVDIVEVLNEIYGFSLQTMVEQA